MKKFVEEIDFMFRAWEGIQNPEKIECMKISGPLHKKWEMYTAKFSGHGPILFRGVKVEPSPVKDNSELVAVSMKTGARIIMDMKQGAAFSVHGSASKWNKYF